MVLEPCEEPAKAPEGVTSDEVLLIGRLRLKQYEICSLKNEVLIQCTGADEKR